MAKAPFFIVGVERSGTTLLRLMLNSHRNLCVPFESAFIKRFYSNLEAYGSLSEPENAERLLDDISRVDHVKRGGLVEDRAAVLSHPIRTYPDLIDAIFVTYAGTRGKERWGDKTPGQVVDIDLLWKLFPGCYVIHLIRDGRDVALSQRRLPWGRSTIRELATRWRWMTLIGHKTGSLLEGHYLEVRYEDLVRETDPTLQRICAFLREPYDADMLAYHETARAHLPEKSLAWHESSVRPVDPGKVALWKRKMSRTDRALFERHAGDTLELFGYELERLPLTIRARLKQLYESCIA